MLNNKVSVIRKLSDRNMKEHKWRNVLFVSAVLCLTMFVLVLNILITSTYKNLEFYYLQMNGNTSQVVMLDVADADYHKIKNYSGVEEIGKSVYIGAASNQEFDERPTEIRYADQLYAEYNMSLPEQGRMPEQINEIAVDTTIFQNMGISPEIGKTLKIEWKQEDGEIQTEEFEVVGIWTGNNICSNRKIWVSKIFADKQEEGQIDLAFNFNLHENVSELLPEMAEELGLNQNNMIVNWVYDENVQANISSETIVYKIGIVLILICGFLVIFNIIQISVASDIKLYGRMRMIGAVPWQIRFALLRQQQILVVVGIPIGLVAGYGLGTVLVPRLLTKLDTNLAVYIKEMDILISLLLVYVLVVIAEIKWVIFVGKINPLDLMTEENSFDYKSYRKEPGYSVLFQMSLSNIGRYKKRNVIVICLLTIGLVVLSCVYVVNKSYDINKYMDEIVMSDITITEKSLINSWGDYNPKGKTISSEFVEKLDKTGGIIEKGVLYSQNILIEVPENVYRNILEYYERNDGEILEYMSYDVAWTEGYQNFKSSHVCSAMVFGIDGLINDQIASKNRILDGIIDKEKFATGEYVIAQGISSGTFLEIAQPTYNIGDTVNFNGKTYEVMAIVEAPYPVTEGKVEAGSEFNLSFFIPTSCFQELFPENTPRKLFINVDTDKRRSVEGVIDEYVEKEGLPVKTEKEVAEFYKNETSSEMLLPNIVACIIVIIGVVNLINAIITSFYSRKKEFTMLQGIGMTQKQLKGLLALEGINIAIITLILSYFISFVVISTGIRAYLEMQWTATYQLTITPLLIATPILMLICVFVPIGCFERMQQVDIVERLYEDEV